MALEYLSILGTLLPRSVNGFCAHAILRGARSHLPYLRRCGATKYIFQRSAREGPAVPKDAVTAPNPHALAPLRQSILAQPARLGRRSLDETSLQKWLDAVAHLAHGQPRLPHQIAGRHLPTVTDDLEHTIPARHSSQLQPRRYAPYGGTRIHWPVQNHLEADEPGAKLGFGEPPLATLPKHHGNARAIAICRRGRAVG